MSAGAFLASKYEMDDGSIKRIKIQPETAAASIGSANAAPAGAIDSPGSARVGGGNRQYGVKARSVTVRFTGALPDGYKAGQLYRVPILTPAVYNAINVGDTGTYLASPVEVVGKNPERVR